MVTPLKWSFHIGIYFFSFRDIDVFQDNCTRVFVLCKLGSDDVMSCETKKWSSIKFAPEMYIKTEIKLHPFPPCPSRGMISCMKNLDMQHP